MLPLFLCPQNGRSGTTSAGSSVFPVPRAGGLPCDAPRVRPPPRTPLLSQKRSSGSAPLSRGCLVPPGKPLDDRKNTSGALAIHGCGPCHAAHIQGSRGAAGHLPGSLLLKASSKSSAMRFFILTPWHAPLTPRTNPIIKKAAGCFPAAFLCITGPSVVSGLIHGRNGRLLPGNPRSGPPRSPAAAPKHCSAGAWSSGGCRQTGPHAGASLRPPRAPGLPRR